MNYVCMAVFIAICLIGMITLVYQIYKITIIDSKARSLKHPKLTGLLATSGQNSSGLVLYLLTRKKYPIKNISNEDKLEINRKKKIALVSLIFVVIGAIGFVYCLITI